jgi:transposase
MHRLGFEYKRPQSLPAQADEAKQAGFIEAYEKLLRGLADDEAVYFADGVHPEYQSRPAHGWVRKGDKVALRRTSGRKRINLHGALNLENFHCPLVQAEKINAASTIALFERLEADNPGKRWIHVIADNARYHHARLVRQWLERPGCRIKLIFQPAYAPHLNAIERLWGVMHREVTHNTFYATFAQFTEAIDDFFARRLPRQWQIWRDTITDNFRIISHREFRVLG